MGLYFAGNSLSGSASKGRAAEHPRGVRRIRKAAKPPTAAQGGGPYGGTPSVTASGGDSSLREGALELRLPKRQRLRKNPLRHGFAVPPLPKGEASRSAR